jgi:hypothetical protein
MKRTLMTLAVIALFAPATASAAPNTESAETDTEARLCSRVHQRDRVNAVYDNASVFFFVPVLVRAVSVARGCTFRAEGRSYSGGPHGNTYTLNTMVGGWSCSCE